MISGKPPTREPEEFVTVHVPKFTDTKSNCKVCYTVAKEGVKVQSWCSAPQCTCNNVYLHCTRDKNCFEIWHSKDYHHD